MNYSIIPECYIDTNLVETIVPPAKEANSSGYSHLSGCGTVASVMQKRFADTFALGIIDRDKKAVDYLREFDEIIKTVSLILHKHKHKERHHYFIQICPAVERFILNSAEAIGISLQDYSLPTDLDKLKKITKSTNSKNDPKFKNLFKALLKNAAPDVVKLAAWINYLKTNPYTVNVETIQGL